MDITGITVIHETFGKGIVKEYKNERNSFYPL